MNICLEGGRESSLSCSFWWDSFFPLLGLSNTCSYITFSLVTDSTQSGIWRWNIEKSDWKKTQTKRNHCCTIQLNIFIHSNDIYISWFGLGKGINIGLIWKIKKTISDCDMISKEGANQTLTFHFVFGIFLRYFVSSYKLQTLA